MGGKHGDAGAIAGPLGGTADKLPATRLHSVKCGYGHENHESGRAQNLQGEFWSKNDRLKRPMSPHLTIYKMQMTSVLSITHRFTGLAQSGIMYGYALLAVASSQNHAAILAQVQALG